MSRLLRRTAAALIVFLCVPLFLVSESAVSTARATEADNSVTKSGTGRFSGVSVTVDQTTNMRNQVVRVSWTGAQPSSVSGGNFISDYMQIMQCWGDESAPQREKCQFGGLFGDSRGGQATSRREIVNNGQYGDPLETYTAPFPQTAVVPFESVTGKTVTDSKNEFFDSLSTNEIPYGRTSNDGTGEEFFEVQTTREAPGLGCGARLDDGAARACWLVVVPRDDIEVNGKRTSAMDNPVLQTSPLSESNFDNAVYFRLQFEPVGVSCPIGSAERRLLGNEEISEAVVRWQPTLCDETGAIFGFSQLGDDIARRQTLTSDPWMSLVSGPLDPGAVTDGRRVTYAPVGVSGVGIGLVIERYPRESASDETKARKGTRVLSLNLNARLVAKLLTQSYRYAVPGPWDDIAENPLSLLEDPEFIGLNPEFSELQAPLRLYSITNPIGLSDANGTVWRWIADDEDASAFIEGKPDPWGAVVNPHYEDMVLDRQDFPRTDPSCTPYTSGQADLCSLDWLAYAADFHSAARGAIRGLTLATANWDFSADPPRYKASPAQPPGERAVLALIDTATAERYQVPMASLLNGAGEYVAPTPAAMTAAIPGLEDTTVPGVMEANPGMSNKGAYPLTQVTYAVTSPDRLTQDEAQDYAEFVEYAATDGQIPGIEPGQLPDGYVPITPAMRTQALAAAKLIRARTPMPGDDTPDEPEEPIDDEGVPGPDTDEGPGVTTDAPNLDAPSVPELGGTPPSTGPRGTEDDTTDQVRAAAAVTTTSVSPGFIRFVPVMAALVGIGLALVRPAMALGARLSAGRGSPPTGS